MDGMPREGLLQSAADHDCWAEVKRGRTVSLLPEPGTVGADDRRRLVRTIETEIIPRLMVAHRVAPAAKAPGASVPGDAVTEFTDVVLGQDFGAAAAYVDTLSARGATLEALCGELLAPTARRLGEYWESDRCDFAQVTLGLWRLQQVFRNLGPGFPSAAVASQTKGLRALLVPAPGEQHTFGLVMVVEFFRRAGWEVEARPPSSLDELREQVAGGWFDIAGLSISCESRLPVITESVVALREASCNRNVGVLVGGRPFVVSPGSVAAVGADGTASDGAAAPRQAEQVLAALAQKQGASPVAPQGALAR